MAIKEQELPWFPWVTRYYRWLDNADFANGGDDLPELRRKLHRVGDAPERFDIGDG
jgi:hypothetical protein